MSEVIYVTEFKNQFDEWQLFHATRSKEKAYIDAGRSGRVIELVEKSALDEAQKEIEALKSELQDFKFGAQVEAKAGDEARTELAKALAEVERYKKSNETDAVSLRETAKENTAMRRKVTALEHDINKANALLERAGNTMVLGCRCDKRFHLDIMCSDGNRTYYERESCELCSMAKEIEQHRGNTNG